MGWNGNHDGGPESDGAEGMAGRNILPAGVYHNGMTQDHDPRRMTSIRSAFRVRETLRNGESSYNHSCM